MRNFKYPTMQVNRAAVCVLICLAPLVYCQVAPLDGNNNYYDGQWINQAWNTHLSIDYDSGPIIERSQIPLAIIGKGAVEYLLQGAKFLKVDGSGNRLYKKRRHFKDALKDFRTVDPINVKLASGSGTMVKPTREFEASGTIGDRRILLRNIVKDNDNGKFPNVVITRPGELPIIIIYKN